MADRRTTRTAKLPFHTRLRASIFLGVLAALFCQAILISHLAARHEDREAQEEAASAFALSRRALKTQVDQVGQLVGDNCIWSDLYSAIAHGDAKWLQQNMLEGSWIIQPTIVLVLDKDGRPVSQRGPVPVWARSNPSLFPCVASAAQGRSASGLYRLNGRLTIVAAGQVRHSDGSGPPGGVFAFARYVDNDLVAANSKLTGLPTVLCTDSEVLAGKGLPGKVTVRQLTEWQADRSGLSLHPIGPGQTAAVGPILDAHRNRVATLTVVNYRPGSAALAAMIRWSMVLAALFALAMAGLVGTFMSAIVCKRLEAFANEVKRVASGNFQVQLKEDGTGDAFDVTAQSFNSMAKSLANAFDSLEDHNAELEAERDTVQILNEQLADKNAKEEQLYEQLQWQYSQLEVASRRLQDLAHKDGLTGLLNHRVFHERLTSAVAEAARHGQPLSVMMLDVDFFKAYNDALGHPAGDEALRAISKVIDDNTRASDFAARYGGEEFAIGLPHTGLEGAVQLAERIRATVEQLDLGGRKTTVSIGVTVMSGCEIGAPGLVLCADDALYAAKRAGRNRVCSDSSGDTKAA